jgi:hypothetical protein
MNPDQAPLGPEQRPDHAGQASKVWADRLNAFQRTDLEGVERVRLMRRSDSKYVFPVKRMPELLAHLESAYRVLDPGKGPVVPYDNRYFDSADLRCYRDHHNGRGIRFKFRYRRYGNSGMTHFEIKAKNNRGKTNKWRIEVPMPAVQGQQDLSTVPLPLRPPSTAFAELQARQWDPQILQPILDIAFQRFTLVDMGYKDRCTVDTGVSFERLLPDRPGSQVEHLPRSSSWPELAIAEIKQERFSRNSAFVAAMEAMGIRPLRISKYCLGILDTVPGIRYQRFKNKYHRLCQLSGRPTPESYPFSAALYAQHKAFSS